MNINSDIYGLTVNELNSCYLAENMTQIEKEI